MLLLEAGVGVREQQNPKQVGVAGAELRHHGRDTERRYRLSRLSCVLYGPAVIRTVLQDLSVGAAEVRLLLAIEFCCKPFETGQTCPAGGIEGV